MDFIRVQSLITILSHLIFIALSYWAVQSLPTEKIFKKIKKRRGFYIN